MKAIAFMVATVLLSACGDTGRAPATIPLYVAGTEVEGPIETNDGATVELRRADLAFGPLYFCASTQAGDLCDTALLEWTESIVVDALEDEPKAAGRLTGVTGTVRSYMYDLGLSSQFTGESGPLVMPAAGELGGVSLRLSGVATVSDETIDFEAAVPIEQSGDAERGIPVIRVSLGSEREVTKRKSALLVRFDPSPWVRGVQFAALLGADAIPVPQESQAYRSVRTALEAGPRPELDWNFSPRQP